MTTSWTFPSTVAQYPEQGGETAHVSWSSDDNFSAIKNEDVRSIQTNQPLVHIARAPKPDVKNKTYFVRCTGFNFVNIPDIISGIEVKLMARRYGRATDDTIQLCLNDELIGENKASLSIIEYKVYGGDTDLWQVENLTKDVIQDSSFGVVFRFQAHPSWPHKDPALVEYIEMRIH